ncbi:ABC transporter permease [Frankia sp. CNm7]|uniref:ABC transporter permease n=1 Tax=Frankia nepalensis TaxID=1836974 RepID=A0A937UPV4_9ACTN|nr:ABC transporter permease subunit [Frankia nepalensis]MBL7495410.1 ABC transporter permease [Frankia nepalensis]MBL7514842.1 ABC transporter permease [Frankia nepalensis]MBL7522429.1 ABC transporter permease [Frankia nepalensis]MBL7625966.1 ABC transporter permease [Frankia nepalensis]
MIRAFLAEWLPLGRRRFVVGTFSATAAVAALGAVLTFLSTGTPEYYADTPHPGRLASASGLVQGLNAISILLGVVGLCVVAASLAGDYGRGTLRNQLMAQPHRLRLLAGKCLALVTFLALVVLAAAVVSVALSFALAPVKGVSTDAWTSAAGMRELGKGVANNLVNAWGFGVLGALAAIVFRSPAASISVGLAYVLPVEIIVAGIWEPSGSWLPGQLLQDIANGGHGYATPYADAGLRVLAYGLVAAVITALLFRYRDVTS